MLPGVQKRKKKEIFQNKKLEGYIRVLSKKSIYIEREIIRNWLTWSQTPRRPKTCRHPAGAPAVQVVYRRVQVQSLRTRRANGTNFDPRPSPKAGDD